MPATGGPFATILVVQEIFGVHEHIKDICRRLAKAGYFAIAPELYARQGNPSTYSDIPKLVAEVVSKVPDSQVIGDLDATVVYAKSTGKGEPDPARHHRILLGRPAGLDICRTQLAPEGRGLVVRADRPAAYRSAAQIPD
jgi:hypothetical protein